MRFFANWYPFRAVNGNGKRPRKERGGMRRKEKTKELKEKGKQTIDAECRSIVHKLREGNSLPMAFECRGEEKDPR